LTGVCTDEDIYRVLGDIIITELDGMVYKPVNHQRGLWLNQAGVLQMRGRLVAAAKLKEQARQAAAAIRQERAAHAHTEQGIAAQLKSGEIVPRRGQSETLEYCSNRRKGKKRTAWMERFDDNWCGCLGCNDWFCL
jgi:hypothetical protein